MLSRTLRKLNAKHILGGNAGFPMVLSSGYHSSANLYMGRKTGSTAFDIGPRDFSKKQKRRHTKEMTRKDESVDLKNTKQEKAFLDKQMSSDDIMQFIEDTKKQLGPIVKDLMLPDSKSILFGDSDASEDLADRAMLRGDNGKELLKEMEKCDPDLILRQLRSAADAQLEAAGVLAIEGAKEEQEEQEQQKQSELSTSTSESEEASFSSSTELILVEPAGGDNANAVPDEMDPFLIGLSIVKLAQQGRAQDAKVLLELALRFDLVETSYLEEEEEQEVLPSGGVDVVVDVPMNYHAGSAEEGLREVDARGAVLFMQVCLSLVYSVLVLSYVMRTAALDSSGCLQL